MPYNSPMKKKGSSCMQMKDYKGKPSGLMMEGSAMHMSMLHKESDKQEKKDLMKDMPVDDKASAIEMSPYKMDHGSPAKKTDEKEGNPKTGKNVTYRLKGTSHMYDDEGFLLPQYSGASQSNQDAEYGIILSDLNTMDQRTYSVGDEERDFEYRDGGYQITRGGTREQNIFPSARGTGVVTDSTTRQYTPEEMKDIVRQTREYNRPILDAVKRSNRGDYTQEQIDIYNKRQDKDRNRYRRRPGQPTLSPRYRSARG